MTNILLLNNYWGAILIRPEVFFATFFLALKQEPMKIYLYVRLAEHQAKRAL